MGCFLIGVTGKGFSKTGETLIGSVSDDPYDVRTFMKAVHADRCLSHLGTELFSTSEHTLEQRGYFARVNETTRGINEEGVAFTCAMVIEDEKLQKPKDSVYFGDVTEEMMKGCATVEEAISLFRSKERVNPSYSLLLADAKGDLAHLEVGNYGIVVHRHLTKEQPGALFAVNCYLSQALVKYNASHTVITNLENNNSARRERGEALEQKFQGEMDVDKLAALLSDHANRERDPMKNPILPAWGYSICNHGTRKSEEYPAEDLPWGTVSAEIMQPAKKLFWYAYGWPCGEKPEYGDQLYQDRSWGTFRPFGFALKQSAALTTPLGELTEEGEISIKTG